MRHQKSGLKLNMTSSHKKAMFRNMVTSLLKHDRIQTTSAKAKELRGWADHVITLAKRGDLHARRQALAIVREKEVVYKLFDEAQKRFGSTSGGYTRLIKVGFRPGDKAPVTMVELISVEKAPKKKKVTGKKAAKKVEAVKPVEETKAVEQEEKVEEHAEEAEEVKAKEAVAPEADATAEETPSEQEEEKKE
ncbi:MAG: 50S ribosomal protein L17 [Desulfobacterales bacterium]|nr:50S ribosomal protein L17 [Desulfobacterales bacterium]